MIEYYIFFNRIDYAIPYDYYNRMHGFVTSLLGDNHYGSNTHNFIYTNLIGGDNLKEGIKFSLNPYFIIRFNDNDSDLNLRLINQIGNVKEAFFGLTISHIRIRNIDEVEQVRFRTIKQSPILVSKKFAFRDNLTKEEIFETEKYIMNTIIEKAKKLDFNLDENLKIKIIRQHNHKDINYNGIINKGRVFEFKIYANNDTKKFIMMNGIGRSCGCGFGFII